MVLDPILLDVAMLAVGIVIVYAAAEGLVDGAASVARAVGVTPVVIGLTVVAFGTSAPEMVISAVASFEQAQGIALGNVVGSNVANVGLVLGIAAVVAPIHVHTPGVIREVGAVLASAVLMLLVALDGVVGRIDGALLLGAMGAFLVYSYRQARSGRHSIAPTVEAGEGRPVRDLLLVGGGLVGVAVGAWSTVTGAIGVATRFGVPEVVIGLTVVSLGTSLPEMATSAVASWRREGDIGVGNVIGSNLFNTLAVLGLAAAINPMTVDPGTLTVGIPVMFGFSLVLVPMLREGFVLERWMGAGMVAAFAAFWAYLLWSGSAWVA